MTNPYLGTYKPPKESILDRLSGCLATLCLLFFFTCVLDLRPAFRLFKEPIQTFCQSVHK